MGNIRLPQLGIIGLPLTGDNVVATTVRQAEAFIPLSLPSPEAQASDIRIELRRGAMAVSVSWPLSAAGPCAGWLRELLK